MGAWSEQYEISADSWEKNAQICKNRPVIGRWCGMVASGLRYSLTGSVLMPAWRPSCMHGSNRIGFSIWQWNKGHLLQDESSDCPPQIKVATPLASLSSLDWDLIIYSLGYNLEGLRNQPKHSPNNNNLHNPLFTPPITNMTWDTSMLSRFRSMTNPPIGS